MEFCASLSIARCFLVVKEKKEKKRKKREPARVKKKEEKNPTGSWEGFSHTLLNLPQTFVKELKGINRRNPSVGGFTCEITAIFAVKANQSCRHNSVRGRAGRGWGRGRPWGTAAPRSVCSTLTTGEEDKLMPFSRGVSAETSSFEKRTKDASSARLRLCASGFFWVSSHRQHFFFSPGKLTLDVQSKLYILWL